MHAGLVRNDCKRRDPRSSYALYIPRDLGHGNLQATAIYAMQLIIDIIECGTSSHDTQFVLSIVIPLSPTTRVLLTK